MEELFFVAQRDQENRSTPSAVPLQLSSRATGKCYFHQYEIAKDLNLPSKTKIIDTDLIKTT